MLKKLHQEPELGARVIERAQRLWLKLYQQEERQEEECELAVLLAALSQTGLPHVAELLAFVAAHPYPAVSWIAALAIQLQEKRKAGALNASFPLAPDVRRATPVALQPS